MPRCDARTSLIRIVPVHRGVACLYHAVDLSTSSAREPNNLTSSPSLKTPHYAHSTQTDLLDLCNQTTKQQNNMETISNIASTATTTVSNLIYSNQDAATKTNETAGKEPVSGLTGKGTVNDPYDQGNSGESYCRCIGKVCEAQC